ncbi:MAG: DUF4920 domain-containing protein [Bryobacteraceae bacterium]
MRPAALPALFLAPLLLGETPLGKAPSREGAIPVTEAIARRQALVGNTVRVRGQIAEVCQMAGCWAALRDPNGAQVLRVKVPDGEITFPKESVGRPAIVEGEMQRFDLTREQAIARENHEAEEQGRKPRKTVPKSEWTVYQIAAAGALLLD